MSDYTTMYGGRHRSRTNAAAATAAALLLLRLQFESQLSGEIHGNVNVIIFLTVLSFHCDDRGDGQQEGPSNLTEPMLSYLGIECDANVFSKLKRIRENAVNGGLILQEYPTVWILF